MVREVALVPVVGMIVGMVVRYQVVVPPEAVLVVMGVSSYAQEKSSASGKPIINKMTTSLISSSDNSNIGNRVSTIWITNQEAAR